jgi:large subunit ribosomal protein L11
MILISKCINLYIRSQGADPGPPLGTVLGNLGVNAVKFCKDFNDFTKELPDYLVLGVYIYIYIDKSFFFRIFEPTLNNLLTLLIKYDNLNNI